MTDSFGGAEVGEVTSPAAHACTGDAGCKAIRHVHGCFADRGDCDHPSEHGSPAAHAETIRAALDWVDEAHTSLDALVALAERAAEAERFAGELERQNAALEAERDEAIDQLGTAKADMEAYEGLREEVVLWQEAAAANGSAQDAAEERAAKLEEALAAIDAVLTPVEGDAIVRGESPKLHARGIARAALGEAS